MWKEKHSTKLISFSKKFIDLQIQIPQQQLWRLIGFYGFHERQRRKDSWELLRQLKNKPTLPWCCVDDFNDMISQLEKRGGQKQSDYLINGFLLVFKKYAIPTSVRCGNCTLLSSSKKEPPFYCKTHISPPLKAIYSITQLF